jgi:glycosyltransferase involved in cell wall biosynthesis
LITITVVIPTYNRMQDLEQCLKALQAQSLADGLFDVVIVDDGSVDDTSSVLKRWAASWPRLRFIRQTNRGPATARNAGVAHATGSIIAFTDDDCQPAPDWLQRIHDRFSQGFHGCLHGTVRSSLPSSPFVHSVIGEGAVITSNLAIEQSVFENIGRFDADFRAPWCEDADLYYRLRKASVPILYDPDLIVDHPPRYQTFSSFLKKSRFFQYYGLIARKHPDMEPLSSHRDRLILAGKKIALIVVVAMVLSRIAPVPFAAALLLAPMLFCLVDAYRLLRIKTSLSRNGIRVRPADQLLYVLLNWTSNIAEGYYLLKGAVVFGSWSGR